MLNLAVLHLDALDLGLRLGRLRQLDGQDAILNRPVFTGE